MKFKNIFWAFITLFAVSTAFVSCEGEDDGLGDIDTPIKPEDNDNRGLVDLTNEMFNAEVFDLTTDAQMKNFKGNKPVFIDFGAEWCGNCHKMHPIVEKVANTYGKYVNFYYADQDICQEVHDAFSAHFGLGTLPLPSYVIIEKDGTISKRYEGLMTEEALSKLIEELIGDVEPEPVEALVNLTTEMFNAEVFDLTTDAQMKNFKGNKPVFIDFGAEWCGNCHKMHPIVEKVANKYYPNVRFYYADQDLCQEVHDAFAAHFGLGTLPLPSYVIIENDGTISKRYEGLMTEEAISNLVEGLLK